MVQFISIILTDYFLFYIIMHTSTFSAVLPSHCPKGYLPFGGRCYAIFDDEKNFDEAEIECNKLPGGHLAAFYDQDTLGFLRMLTV